MTIRTFTTLGGARRAFPEGPIIRLLDEGEVLYVGGLTGARGVVSAIGGEPPKVDGSVDVLDLITGGTLAAHNRAGPAVDTVLDVVVELRPAALADDDFRQLAKLAARSLGDASAADNLTDRREGMVKAAAALILGVELIDRELGS